MFIQNFCTNKQDKTDDNETEASQMPTTKRAKTAGHGARRAKSGTGSRTSKAAFERAPIFQEIYELQKQNKMDAFTNKDTVGWGSMLNKNPMTGAYMGNP